jgi:hypothetical protein
MPGEPATDICIGPDGNVYLIGTDVRPNGFGVYRFYHGTDWDCYEGAGVRISAAPDGLAWLVDARGSLFQQHVRL